MRNNTELTAEQAKVLEEEEQLLLLVKQGLLMLAAEDKESNIKEGFRMQQDILKKQCP